MITCTDFSIECINQHSMHSYSLRYLSMLFGSWVYDVFGSGTSSQVGKLTPLMGLLGGLNIVSLLYATIIATYRTGHITLNIAATGEAFHKLSPYTLLRIAASLALVAPYVQGDGSFVGNAQASGMWVITRGVGMADLFNRAGIQLYLNSEGDVIKDNYVKSTFVNGEAITNMMICTALSTYKDSTKNAITDKPFNLYFRQLPNRVTNIPMIAFGDETSTVPTMGNVKTLLSKAIISEDASTYRVYLKLADSECGTISFDVISQPKNSAKNLEKVAYFSNFEKVDQLLVYLTNIYKASQIFVQNYYKADLSKFVTSVADIKSVDNKEYLTKVGIHKFSESLFNAHANFAYCNSMAVKNAFNGDYKKLSSKECKSSDNTSIGLNLVGKSGALIDELSDGGWIFTANAFTRLNGLIDVASSQTMFDESNIEKIAKPGKSYFCQNSYFRSFFGGVSINDPKTVEEMVDMANDCKAYWASKELPSLIWNYTKEKVSLYEITPNSDKVRASADWSSLISLSGNSDSESGADTRGAAVSVASYVLKSLLNIGYSNNLVTSVEKPFETNINVDTVLFDSSGRTNAITVIASMGEGLKTVYNIMLLANSVASETAAKLSNTGGIFGLAGGIIAKYIANLLAPVVMACMTGAFLMSTVIPNIPIFTMIFIVVGFFVIAFESIAGVTFAVALLGSSEGEGLLQLHGARMVSLYASIFLRPTLHTIGFFGGYALCNIGYAILASLFWNNPFFDQMSFVDIFSLIFITGAFPIFLCAIVVYCMKIPNLNANNISSWMATDLVGAFGDASEYMSSTQQAFEKMSASFQQSMKAAGGNNNNNNNNNNQSPKQDPEEKPSIPSSSAK